jgi:5-formyltetrahydrofolate cyclo-ligase
MIELRRQLRQLRKSIDEKTRKEDGQNLLPQCQKPGLFENATHIAIYTPNDGEIETEDTNKFLKNNGSFVYLPIVVEE